MIGQPFTHDDAVSRQGAGVAISLFGPLTLTVNGQVVTRFRSNKTRALLAYLLLAHPQPLLRTTVRELLWSGYAEQSAQANLRQTLANLRECLAPFDLIEGSRTHLSCRRDPAIFWCDVHAFEQLLNACYNHDHGTLSHCPLCRARLQEAIALYTAPLLDGFAEIDSTPFTAWFAAQRARLAGYLAEAQALLAAGSTARGNLPIPLTPLIGRTTELTRLERHLQHTIYRCTSLVGPGGIGKTRLASALGAHLQPHFPDGVWLIELSGLAPAAPDEPPEWLYDRLATAIGQVMGIPFAGTVPPATQVANFLRTKVALLILDSFEQLLAAAAWLPTLLTEAGALRLLITTRHRLPLQSQLVYVIEGLRLPPEATGDLSADQLLTQYASVQLFVERAESAGVVLPLDHANLTTIGQLCRFVDGSPWAIELAVALLDQQTPAAILAAIQTNYRTLTSHLLDVPLRQRSAAAVFQTSWALLTGAEAQTLACCAVFRGGFTLAMAQTIAAATLPILEALVHKSLLQQSGTDRYAMHDLVRQFAGEQLAQDVAVAEQVHAAHAAYFMALLATWHPDDATEEQFRTAVTRDWENVQAAWTWALAADQVPLLQQGVRGLAEFYQLMGLYPELDRIFGTAVARIRRLLDAFPMRAMAPSAARTSAQTLLSHLLWQQLRTLNVALGRTEQAQHLAEELVAWGRQLGDGALEAGGYYELSIVALLQGDYQRQ